MTVGEFAAIHPRLYHGTDPVNVAGIARLGLSTTAELLNRHRADDATRAAIASGPRPDGVTLRSRGRPAARLRDQSPLCNRGFATCLDGVTPAEWLALLNNRVFFWPTERRLAAHLGGRVNRTRGHHVFVIETASLLGRYADSVELSPINSGSAIRRAAKRGRETFVPLLGCDFDVWRGKKGRTTAVAEVTVTRSVPDVADFVLEERSVTAEAA